MQQTLTSTSNSIFTIIDFSHMARHGTVRQGTYYLLNVFPFQRQFSHIHLHLHLHHTHTHTRCRSQTHMTIFTCCTQCSRVKCIPTIQCKFILSTNKLGKYYTYSTRSIWKEMGEELCSDTRISIMISIVFEYIVVASVSCCNLLLFRNFFILKYFQLNLFFVFCCCCWDDVYSNP